MAEIEMITLPRDLVQDMVSDIEDSWRAYVDGDTNWTPHTSQDSVWMVNQYLADR